MTSVESDKQHPYRPGYEAIAEKILTFVIAHKLHPGDRLPTEMQLAEQLGVSRAMVREAIKVLSAQGHIRSKRGSGIFVGDGTSAYATGAIDLSMPVDHEHMLALFEFRCLQEMLTARLAAERITVAELRALEEAVDRNQRGADRGDWDLFIEADVAFHQGIANATHNSFLVETVASTFRLQRWATKLITGGTPGSLSHSAEQHRAILNAIKTGQPELAASAMQTHVQTVLAAYQHEMRRLLAHHFEQEHIEGQRL